MEGESGFIVPVGDSDKMANSMLEVLNNQKLRNSMSGLARSIVEKKYSAQKICDSLRRAHLEVFFNKPIE